MYQKVLIEGQSAFVPILESQRVMYEFNVSSYYIRARFCPGHVMPSSFFARLGGLDFTERIRNLSLYFTRGSINYDHVFAFDAGDAFDVLNMFRQLNMACVNGKLPPLPDLEFVHPAAHALLYSLGGFSGSSADCYLSADPDAINLNATL